MSNDIDSSLIQRVIPNYMCCAAERSLTPTPLSCSPLCPQSHVQEQAPPGWLEVQMAPLYAADGRSYLTLQPVRDADQGHFQHITHVDVPRKQLTTVTIGAFQVLELLGWDEARQVM